MSVQVNIGLGQWESSAQSELTKIFKDYADYMVTAHDLDYKAMEDEADRLEDQLDEGCSDNAADDIENFYAQVKATWDEAKKYWEEFTTAYDTHLGSGNARPHAVAPIMLPVAMDAKRQILENDVVAKLGDFEQTVSQSQIGTYWTGKGAEGYAKQIPIQAKAMSDLKSTAQAEMNTMQASAMIQQSIFLSVMTSVKRIHYTVKDLDVSNTDDRWAERIYTMRDLNKDLKEWFEEFQDEFSSSWGTIQSNLISAISETEGGYQELSGEDWPAATAASTGYQPDPNAGSTGPGTTGPGTTGPGTTGPGTTGPDTDYPGTEPGAEYPGADPTGGGMDTSGAGQSGQTADKDTYE